MDAVNKLLDKAKEVRSLRTDMALAEELGVTRAAVSDWRNGRNLPGTLACARISEVTGEPLARVMGLIGEARAISRDEKAVWRRLAAAATLAGICLVGGAGFAPTSQAAVSVHAADFNSNNLYIMRSLESALISTQALH